MVNVYVYSGGIKNIYINALRGEKPCMYMCSKCVGLSAHADGV
jgi:hypothetical protein